MTTGAGGVSLPLPLQTALESGQCVLFVGAGVGKSATGPEGHRAPLGSELAVDLAAHFEIATESETSLDRVAEVVQLRRGRPELDAYLTKRLASLQPDSVFDWITTVRWGAIFTTNYDDLIEKTYDRAVDPRQTPVTASVSADVESFDPRFQVPVFHLHGSLVRGEERRIVVTQGDYATFRKRRGMLFDILKQRFATSTFLYLGYSNLDPNWRLLLAELQEDFYPSTLPLSYRVAPSTDPIDREILKAQSIHTIDATLEEFVALATSVLSITPDDRGIGALQGAIPADLTAAFEESPAAVARLLQAWTYVNAAPFTEDPNTRDFLRGDFPNWGLIGQDLPFARDLEDDVLDAALDYATSESVERPVIALLGPAGFGVTTLLMRLAAQLVHEKAGPVFFHRPGTPLREADVVFASRLFHERPFFVVDNAADFSGDIAGSVFQLRDLQRPALILAGERLNEWRQRPAPLHVAEFGLTALSDAEIERLLDFLAERGALNKLGELERPLQRAVIREKSEKQLLVAMREATEGSGFDAIIEDEFRGLADDHARRAYASVSALYRLRTYVRDQVLAATHGLSLVDFYDRTGRTLDGVVLFDLIDDAMGEYAARTRHHVIAEIVWERCVDAPERELLILAVLEALNLNYFVDREAFDAVVRSDRTIDSLSGLEAKIGFFESARQKDPESPYVLQHYARMLLREGKADLALAQIDRALDLAPRARVLHHTRGVVLRGMAMSLPSVDLARRRLLMSEQAFRQALRLDERDEYSYQALAELFFGWAKRVADAEEQAAYLTKTQEILDQGLRKVRSREGLWIVFSDLESWLGNTPAAREALESAVRASPEGRIGRFLLGRSLRRAGERDEAETVLAAVLEAYPEDYRAGLEYARTLLELGRSRARAIAVLEVSRPAGFRDAAYIATLGGLLFLEERFSEAEDVFGETARQPFSYREKTRVALKARDADGRKEVFRGEVRSVKTGFAFVDAPGYPSFLLPGTRYGDLVIARGLVIEFTPGFTARGAIAVDPRIPE